MIDPPVSDPIEKPTSPAAVAEPGPADDPDASSSVFQGFRVRPPNQRAVTANAPVESFATRIAPASVNRLYTLESNVDDPVAVRRHSPRCLRSPHGEQVFESPWNTMQRSAICARGDFFVSPASLALCQIFGEIDNAQKFRIVLLQARQVQFREICRLDLSCLDQLG